MKEVAYSYRDSKYLRLLSDIYTKGNIWYNGDLDNLNETCRECHEAARKNKKFCFYGPALPWYIGSKWDEIYPKILFVGKALEKDPKNEKSHLIKDKDQALGYLYNLEKYDWEEGSQFIRFVPETIMYFIKKGLFGTDFNNCNPVGLVSFTNLVKCGAGIKQVSLSLLNKVFAPNCVNKLELLDHEINILNPDVVIFLTSDFFSKPLCNKYFSDNLVKVGTKYRAGEYYWINEHKGRLFICGWHPGRKSSKFIQESREVFFEQIKNFINKKKNQH